MRSTFAALLVSFLALSSAFAEIKIDGERAVKENSFAELTVKDAAAVVWRVYPSPVKTVRRGNLLCFSGKPSVEYLVTAMTIDFEAKSFEETETTVTFAGGSPLPDIEAAPRLMGFSLQFGPWSNGTKTGSTASVTGTAKITGGDPPGPAPDPIPPSDPLVAAIKATGTPAAKLSEIAIAFRACADLSATGQTASRNEQLRAMALKSGIPGGVPDSLHSILAGELKAVNTIIPPSDPEHVITESDRDKIRAVYTKLATALEAAR